MRPFIPLRALTAFVAILVLAGVALPVLADTEDRLDDARAQLQDLEAQMESDRAAFELMERELAATKEQVEAAKAAYEQLGVKLDQTESGVEDAETRYEQIRADIGEMVRTAYMQGPAGPMAFLLDSESQDDLADRLSYLSATTESATTLAAQATELVSSLEDRGDEIQQLLKDKERVLKELDHQKEEFKQAAEQREQALDRLTATRDELLDLVVRLRRQLSGPDLDALQRLFQGEASVPYGTWAEAFLAQINAPACRDNLVAMVAWQLNEGTSADWNPLATTYDMPGASAFNSFGVRNYVSLKQGLEATWLTLKRGWSVYGYAPIVQSLRRCGSAMKTAEAINASSWCRGCTYGRYVTGLIDRVAADYPTYAKL